MELKVNYDTLQDISDKVISKNDTLKSLIRDLIKIVDGLDAGWTGRDSESFKTTAITYLNSLSSVTNELEFIGKYIGKSANAYSYNDNRWKEDIKIIGEDEDGYR